MSGGDFAVARRRRGGEATECGLQQRQRRGSPRTEQGEQRGGEPLEVDGRDGRERLDAHVLQPAPHGARQAVPALGLAVEPFRAPAAPLVEPRVLLGPPLLAPAGFVTPRASGPLLVGDADPG